MGETRDDVYEEELVDYEEEEEKAPDSAAKVNGEAPKKWVFALWIIDLFSFIRLIGQQREISL